MPKQMTCTTFAPIRAMRHHKGTAMKSVMQAVVLGVLTVVVDLLTLTMHGPPLNFYDFPEGDWESEDWESDDQESEDLNRLGASSYADARASRTIAADIHAAH